MNILVCQALTGHRLHRFGFRGFLRRESRAIQHVQKIGVAAGIQLIRAHKFHPALAKKIHQRPVHDGGAHLRLNIVTDKGQIFIGETLRPCRIARDEYRDVVDKTQACFERTTGIEAGGLFGADWKIIDHQFRGGVFQLGNDLFAGGFFLQWKKCAERILIVHVRGVAVQNAAHFYNGAGELDLFTEHLRTIRRRENGPADISSNLAPINIKGGNDFNVARAIRADLAVHQPYAGAVGGEAVIKIYPLDKRAGAVSNPDNGDSYFSHF